MQESTSQASYFGRSFLIIVVAYMCYMACMFAISAIIFAVAYPDLRANWNLPEDEFEQLKRNDPQQLIPPSFNVAIVLVNAVCATCAGWLVARIAPFGKFGHGVFFAVVIAVSWFQLGTSDETILAKWVLLTNIIIAPISILFGASKATMHLDSELVDTDPDQVDMDPDQEV
jgi:hypothetical protein